MAATIKNAIYFLAQRNQRISATRAFHLKACLTASDNVGDKITGNEDFKESTFISKFTESKELFNHVRQILPYKSIPKPPTDVAFPTPSGWIPPSAQVKDEYFVGRSKNHMLPVYLEQKIANTRKYTKIGKIEGDIWALEGDLRSFLSETMEKGHIYTQVNEVTRCIRIKGIHVEKVAEFLLKKGF